VKTAYKILKNGRSFHGGTLKWSLPKDGKPGDWHEIEGELKRCRNGLHVTTDPRTFFPKRITERKSIRCYEVEYDGQTIEESDWGEIVAQRVRLIREVTWEEVTGESPISPALTLLDHVWGSQGKTTGHGHSWRRLNAAMQSALRLAIESGMEFGEDDFAVIRREYGPEYWLHIENCYAMAIDAQHGPNPSAYQAIEKHLGRKPFVIQVRSSSTKQVRLHEGARFYWHEDMKKEVFVKVTSFGEVEREINGIKTKAPCVIACSYKERSGTGYEADKIDRMFKITHEDIKTYHKAIREQKKSKAS
jgi:hypothetical protein